ALHLVLTVQAVNTATAQPVQVLFDGVVSASPAFARYAAVNGGSFNASIQYARIQRVTEALVQSAPAGQGWSTRVLFNEGSPSDCEILGTRQLKFFAGHVPAAGERIVARYRVAGRALAMATDSASIAAQPQNAAGGVSAAVLTFELPAPSSTAECEQA